MDASFSGLRPGPNNLITDVQGISVGQAKDRGACTGVTVVMPDTPAVAAVDQRGGAPGTRETDLLDPACLVDRVDAIVLSGGSVYGLDAASGATAWLGAKGRGFEIAGSPLRAPIVPCAIIQDLNNGGDKGWGATPPYRALAIDACEAASGAAFALGTAGAGTGASAGTLKGGTGSASIMTTTGLAIGALAVVNAFGSALVPGTDVFWAEPFEIDGEFGGRRPQAPPSPVAVGDPIAGSSAYFGAATPGANTTLAVVATNAALSPAETKRLAIMAQDGLARAIRPAHAPVDGDIVFALTTATETLPEPRPLAITQLGALAGDTLARAIARGVYEATSLGRMVAYRERFG